MTKNPPTNANDESRPAHQNKMLPADNKFHKGARDGKHYWLTPPDLFKKLAARFGFDFDPCPFPKPEDFDGLTCEWGISSYVNPPFGAVMHQGKKKGATAWARKAIEEHKKGKRVVLVHPIDKWVLMLIAAGAKIENLGDVRWCATEDGSQGKGTGRHIAMFILDHEKASEARMREQINELAALLKEAKQEMHLIRTKDCDAVYDPTLRTRMDIALANITKQGE